MTSTSRNQIPSCHSHRQKIDYLLWGSIFVVTLLYLYSTFLGTPFSEPAWYNILAESVYELINTVWIGIVVGILMVTLLSVVPKEFVVSILGRKRSLEGILRATAAGVLLDLCSHGILMVGAKLYERGASIGQVMAFLIASPWNSFSLTFILITLIGIPWTLTFIGLSIVIAIVAGLLFDKLVQLGYLSENPHQATLPSDFKFWPSAKRGLLNMRIDFPFIQHMVINGIKESSMVLKWARFKNTVF